MKKYNSIIDIKRLQKAIKNFTNIRVLVLGDIMLDEFIWGKVRRMSPEAPVPIIELDTEAYMLGGALNVLHNIISLGASASIGGLIGNDRPASQLLEFLNLLNVETRGLLVCEDRFTTVKTRILAHSQQVLRVDYETKIPLKSREVDYLIRFIESELSQVDAIIVSDYAKGIVTARLIKTLMALSKARGCIVNIDPKVINMELYTGGTVITPNHLEAADAACISVKDNNYIQRAGRVLLKKLQVGSVIITQGENGITVFTDNYEVHIPTAAKRVYDVTGAGDTVISVLTLGLAVGLDQIEAALIANFAAGIVVGEMGTSTVSANRLMQVIDEEALILIKKFL